MNAERFLAKIFTRLKKAKLVVDTLNLFRHFRVRRYTTR